MCVTKTCRTCIYRDAKGYCTCLKITDVDWRASEDEKLDMMIYGHHEEGGFHVGDNFGCVHHKENHE